MQPGLTPNPSNESTYDLVPYQSHSYSASHPRRLSVIARLFGLNPHPISSARVLEIGCASGGNLIPIAAAFPGSHCVGIDYSARQIADGQRDIAALGLENVRLEHFSVADITPEFGQFDYIICHGVFSWVSPDIQKHILRVSKENLAENGIVYVSYNTLPGWNSIKSLRDMMLYHTAQFADPAMKVTEAVRMLRFALEASQGQDTAWSRAIEQELKTLETAGGWYLYHDHLESQNNPVYFHQFAQMAADVGLQYAGESVITTMFVDNLPTATADTLRKIKEIVRQEQYMDFVRNRRFRMTLLTHANHIIKPAIANDSLLDFHLTSNELAPDFDPTAQDWSVDTDRSFGKGSVVTHTASGAMALLVLHESGNTPIAATDLITQAAARLGQTDEAPVKKALLEVGVRLLFHGRLIPHEGPYGDAAMVAEKPEIWPLARYQAKTHGYVTSLRHDTVNIDQIMRELIPLVDGTRSIDEIIDEFAKTLATKGANFEEGGAVVTQLTRQREIVAAKTLEMLKIFCAQKLMVV
jgi:methyltransferase-like protein/protein-L-isoaspartate O-methyltransferase